MEEYLLAIFKDSVTEELYNEISKSFSIFDYFEYKDYYTGFDEILDNADNIESLALTDILLELLNNKLDNVLLMHSVVLIDDATIEQKNELLKAIYCLQKPNNVEMLLGKLDSFEDDIIVISSILSEYCSLDVVDIVSIIKDIGLTFRKNLKAYLKTLDREDHLDVTCTKEHIYNIKIFFNTFGKNNLGYNLVTEGLKAGYEFCLYMPFIKPHVQDENRQITANNILSVLILASDTNDNLLESYRNISSELIEDLNVLNATNQFAFDSINRYLTQKKVEDEKARLS